METGNGAGRVKGVKSGVQAGGKEKQGVEWKVLTAREPLYAAAVRNFLITQEPFIRLLGTLSKSLSTEFLPLLSPRACPYLSIPSNPIDWSLCSHLDFSFD